MSLALLIVMLEFLNIIKEGRPLPFTHQLTHYLRVVLPIGVLVFLVFNFIKRKKPNNDI